MKKLFILLAVLLLNLMSCEKETFEDLEKTDLFTILPTAC